MKAIKRNKKSGATLVEYGLVAALVSVASITALTSLGTGLVTLFDSIVAAL